MINYRQIVIEQRDAIERAIQVLNGNEPLDAADEEIRAGMENAVDALDATLRAFDEAEGKALDAMYAHYAATGRIECGGERIACANTMVDDGKIECTGCGERFTPDEIVYCFNDVRCCAECEMKRPEKWGE